MTKFNKVIPKKEQEIIQSVFVNLAETTKDKINIVETMENIYYLHQDTFFNTLTREEKIKVYIGMSIFIDTFLDEEMNPLVQRHTLRAFDCFNNNIFYVVKGGAESACLQEMP